MPLLQSWLALSFVAFFVFRKDEVDHNKSYESTGDKRVMTKFERIPAWVDEDDEKEKYVAFSSEACSKTFA